MGIVQKVRDFIGGSAAKLAASLSVDASIKVLAEKSGLTYSLTDPRVAGLFAQGLGSSTPQWLTFDTTADYLKAWNECPPVVSILCNKAQADINGKLTFKYVNVKPGEEAETVNLSSQLQARALNKLFSKPNALQTWRQFRAQQKIYTQLFGFCPVLMVKPVGFKGADSVTSMWNIPPQYIKVKTTGKLFFQAERNGVIETIEVVINGKTIQLPVEDVVLLKDQYLSLSQEILPDSRIKTLKYPISNVAAAYKAANILITKHGALGILSTASKDTNGPIAMDPEDKKALQAEFSRYGLSEEQWQVIITNASLAWQQMAMPIKDLMLFETIKDAKMVICDTYGHPYELLAKEMGRYGEANAEAKASFYQDTIIPEAESDFEVYNEYFGLNEKDWRMCYSFDHVEVLQKSEKEKAEELQAKASAAKTMFESNVITLNRMREMMGEETVEGDDIYYSEYSLNQEEERSKRIPQQNNAGGGNKSQENNEERQPVGFARPTANTSKTPI